MAGNAVAVNAATESFGVWRAILISIGLMLVVMMTEVLCRRPGLVLAITSDRRPGKLERQENEQKNGKPAAHGGHCIRALLRLAYSRSEVGLS